MGKIRKLLMVLSGTTSWSFTGAGNVPYTEDSIEAKNDRTRTSQPGRWKRIKKALWNHRYK
jgi:hypothetical protein